MTGDEDAMPPWSFCLTTRPLAYLSIGVLRDISTQPCRYPLDRSTHSK